MKYGIALISKYTGDRIVLGSQFDTLESRHAYVNKHVCERCNEAAILRLDDGAVWRDKHTGFDYPKLIGGSS